MSRRLEVLRTEAVASVAEAHKQAGICDVVAKQLHTAMLQSQSLEVSCQWPVAAVICLVRVHCNYNHCCLLLRCTAVFFGCYYLPLLLQEQVINQLDAAQRYRDIVKHELAPRIAELVSQRDQCRHALDSANSMMVHHTQEHVGECPIPPDIQLSY